MSQELKEFFKKVGSEFHSYHSNDKNQPISAEACIGTDLAISKQKTEETCLYIKHPNGSYRPSPLLETDKVLPPDYYQFNIDNSGIYIQPLNINNDELLRLYDSDCNEIIEQIQVFWKKEEHYRKHSFLWKRGFLLWGPPGSGKTCAVQLICHDVIKSGSLVFYINNCSLAQSGFKLVRAIEPNRPIVAIFEDLDAIIRHEGESALLSLLDGENQIDNIVFIATTNYPERLDPRIVNRPSRFDIIKKIGMPNIEARENYLANKSLILKDNQRLLTKYSEDTEGFSFAHIKELIVATEVFELDYEESLDRLKSMIETHPDSNDYQNRKFKGFESSLKRVSSKDCGMGIGEYKPGGYR